MRTHSVYTVECECGAQIESQEKETVCAKCRALVILIWPREKEK